MSLRIFYIPYAGQFTQASERLAFTLGLSRMRSAESKNYFPEVRLSNAKCVDYASWGRACGQRCSQVRRLLGASGPDSMQEYWLSGEIACVKMAGSGVSLVTYALRVCFEVLSGFGRVAPYESSMLAAQAMSVAAKMTLMGR